MNEILNEFEQLELEDKLCGICASPKEKEYTLSCKHSFCYDCILEWLKMKKKNFLFNTNEKLLACPYCRKTIDHIDRLDGYHYIRGIHKSSIMKKQEIEQQQQQQQQQQPQSNLLICNAPINNNTSNLCKNKTKQKYGYYCGKHKKYHLINPKNI